MRNVIIGVDVDRICADRICSREDMHTEDGLIERSEGLYCKIRRVGGVGVGVGVSVGATMAVTLELPTNTTNGKATISNNNITEYFIIDFILIPHYFCYQEIKHF